MRVFIQDLWLKKADDGTTCPARAKRSLSQMADPMRAKVPAKYRTTRYGQGMRWRCRWFQPSPGGRRQVTKGFAHLEDAESFVAAMEDDVRRGRYHDPHQENRLFSDVADEWLASKAGLRASTADRYRRELDAYILPTWGSMPLRAISTRDIQDWVARLSEGTYESNIDHGRRSAQPLAPASIRNVVKIVMGGALGYALGQGWITSNPVRAVTLPKRTTARRLGILTIREVERIARTAGERYGDVMRVLFLFQAYTGARIGETTALRVGDLDLPAHRARIVRTWSDARVDGRLTRHLTLPKNGRTRRIALPESLCPELQRLIKGRHRDDFVFRTPEGTALNERNIYNRVWTPTLKACGLYGQGVTIHSLRHTYASLAISAGADVKTLQQQLGHSSATITLDTYAFLWPDRLDQVEDAVDARRVGYLSASA